MDLIIVESPNKVHTISAIMGSNYTVLPTIGHIFLIEDKFAYNTGIDIQNNFEISYIEDPEKKEIIKKIKEAAKTAKTIYVCSDPDREGHSIAWEVCQILSKYSKKLKRATFDEITPAAVKAAIANPIPFNKNMEEASFARQSIDRITGYRWSNLVLSKLNCKSAGRVQSALLKLIVDKEKEIQNFIPETYYQIFLDFKKGNKILTAEFKMKKNKKLGIISDQKIVDEVLNNCKLGNYSVEDITTKSRLLESKPPFTTSSYQQACSGRFGFSPQRSMLALQHLFEKGYTSYPRTDSIRLNEDFSESAKKKIENCYGKELINTEIKGSKKSEKIQDAHEAIRPTDINNTPSKISNDLQGDELKVYTLIYNRTLASFFIPAIVEDTEVKIGNGDYKFFISGHEITFQSWTAIYNDDSDYEKLPDFKIGEKIKDKELYSEKKETNPPKRYSEAGLVKLMETTGIGRPSTYSNTIETLKKRGYIHIEKKSAIPSPEGIKLSDTLQEYFTDFINDKYTANMENNLDEIGSGNKTRLDLMKEYWKDFEPLILKAQREINKGKAAPEKIGEKCPNCGAELVKRKSRFNTEFIACSRYPHCKFTKSLDGETKISIKTNCKCPKCKKGFLVKREAKKTGEIFYGCSEYSKGCKFTMKEEEFKKSQLPKELNEAIDKEEL